MPRTTKEAKEREPESVPSKTGDRYQKIQGQVRVQVTCRCVYEVGTCIFVSEVRERVHEPTNKALMIDKQEQAQCTEKRKTEEITKTT